MPITASAELAVEVESVEYRRAATLTIYPPASDYLDFTPALNSVNLTAAMTSPLPDNARIQAGDEAVTADFVLGGSIDQADETMSAADFFNPDNPDSPLYHLALNGCRVTFEWGAHVPGSATPETPGLLTAWISGVDFDWAAGTATVHTSDMDPDWRDTPEIPAVVTAAPFNAGLTNEFAMDALIRRMKGASTWPAARPGVVLAAGMRSSVWPEVGSLDKANSQPAFAFAPGVMGSGLTAVDDSVISGIWPGIAYRATDGVTTHVVIEQYVSQGAASSSDGNNIRLDPDFSGSEFLEVQVAPGSDAVLVFYNEKSWTVSTPDTPRYVAVSMTLPAVGDGTVSGTVRVNGTDYALSAKTSTSVRVNAAWPCVLVQGGHIVTEALQVTTESAPAWNDAFTPIAILDPSLNPLTVVPAIAAGTKSWQELQSMAASECGYVRRDPNGVIRFTNRINLLNQSVGRTISGDTSLGPLSTSIQPASANHSVSVSYTEWDYAAPGLVWTIGSKKQLAANKVTTWTQEVTDGTLIAQVDGTATLLGVSDTPGHDGESQYLIAGSRDGSVPHPGLRSLTITQLTATTFQVAADNRSRPTGYLVVPDTYTGPLDAGTAALWIGGIPVSAGDAALVTVTCGDGKNSISFGDSAYLQDHDTARGVGLFVLRQTRWDVREFTRVDIIPDPRILCGDLDKLVESTRSKVNDYVMVWGYTFTATFPPAGSGSAGTWSQTLTARSLGPPDSWLGGAIPDRAEAGVTWAY